MRIHNSERRTWRDMKARCFNPNHPAWPSYGGRGITVCDRWLSFENFSEDMGKRPAKMMLERIDNDGPYSPENCRWATSTDQNRNKRNTVWTEIGGQRVAAISLAAASPLDRSTIRRRILNGWDPVKAATEPRTFPGCCGSKHPRARLTETKVVEIRTRLASGERVGLLAREYGVGQTTISEIKSGRKWRSAGIEIGGES